MLGADQKSRLRLRRGMGFKRRLRTFIVVAVPSCLAAFSPKPPLASSPKCLFALKEFQDFQTSRKQQSPPIPVMPSPLFQQLASSQLELLAASIPPETGTAGSSKIKSMALYLPQENSVSGQLEFLPAVLFPHPTSERVFIATDAATGKAPTLPRTLTKLPGFAHAATLLPGYPMVYSAPNEASVGVVEEVMCDLRSGGAALSVPLFAGSQTVGVLLVSPAMGYNDPTRSVWTARDREQVSRAAKTLSLALAMETQRRATQLQNEKVQEGLADSLHQLKNPLQALRTYGKLLQQSIATDSISTTPQLLELAQHLMVQVDRVVDRLTPIDSLVNALGQSSSAGPEPLAYLKPVFEQNPWPIPLLLPQQQVGAIVRQTRNNSTDSSSVSEWSHSSNRLATQQPRASSKKVAGKTAVASVSSKQGPRSPAKISPGAISDAAWEPSTNTKWNEEMSFVGDVLAPVFTIFDAMARERGISFEVFEADDLPGITLSTDALQEVMSNLLDNAFKYVVLGKTMPERNASPRVRVCLDANAMYVSSGVTIRVEDNGPGISPAEYESIFLRGHRSERTVSVPGTGLGLDICRSLVARMGGRLRVVPQKECNRKMLQGAVLELILLRK